RLDRQYHPANHRAFEIIATAAALAGAFGGAAGDLVAHPRFLRPHHYSRAARLAGACPRGQIEVSLAPGGGFRDGGAADGGIADADHRAASAALLRQPSYREREPCHPEYDFGRNRALLPWPRPSPADNLLGRAAQ